jgi:hypothetical protein
LFSFCSILAFDLWIQILEKQYGSGWFLGNLLCFTEFFYHASCGKAGKPSTNVFADLTILTEANLVEY